MKKSLGPKTLAYPLPAYLIGTYDLNGRANIMTAAWAGIACSEPPCLAVGIRAGRLTHESIIKNQAFTVNFPNSSQAAIVDFAGLVSGRQRDKFAEAGLTAVDSALVKAPYVAECPVVAECRLYKSLELGSHTLFVGEILDIKADEGLESPNGGLDLAKVDPLVFNSGGQYHKVGSGVGQGFSIGKALIKK
ncbi:MAG: flavin reductase family protein [Deltaproteobacteria bacterium]|jgi:flavin reductase (DIM6/NTAB) family NADH-FMN oxidoreductase RutF|nr:flavin reductase family protein [Deltaproteobacteria bacterium]